MSITRTPIINDDGTNTTGTLLDNNWKQELYNQIDAFVGTGGGLTLLSSSLVGAAGGVWSPAGMTGNTLIEWFGSSDLAFDGFATPATPAGAMVRVKNVGAGNIYCRHLSISGAQRLYNIVTSAPTPIGVGGSATWINDGSAWTLIQHEQGALIKAPFSAADFTSDAGSWTVTAGGIGFMGYRVSGRQVSFAWSITTSSVTGTPTYLRINKNQWGGFTWASSQRRGRMTVGYDTAFQTAIADAFNPPYLSLSKLAGTWGATVTVYGDIDIQID